MKISKIQDLLSEALQSDLENGVKWLNELAAEKFVRDYPALNRAIAQIMEADSEDQDE